jgi:hypothetical protein
MNKNILQILWLGTFISIISALYFLSLVFHIPFIATAILTLICGVLSYRYFIKNIPSVTEPGTDKRSMLILAAGVILLTVASAILVRKNGDIDSIANWNFIAKYLYQPEYWKLLFAYSGIDAHPDYPLAYPAAIAFFWRIFGDKEIISLAITYIPTVCIPVMIYLAIYKKHLPIATCLLLIFATNSFYLNCGLNQYADTLLSFYLLGAMLSILSYKKTNEPAFLLLCAVMLGCCIWTKNEGLIIAGIFGLFYLRTFLAKQNLKYFVLGILPFLLILAFFKIAYAPSNDLVSLSDNTLLSMATEKMRYKMIAEYLSIVFNNDFYLLKLIVVAYLAYCVFTRRNLNKNIYMLLSIFGVYLLVYLFTPRDIRWHLATSLNRLILQLYPSFMLIIGLEATEIKFSSSDAKTVN